MIAMKHPKLVRFINKHILKSHKNRYINIYNEKTSHWYQAEFHREQFWYDNERITIKTILSKLKAWYVTYWDAYDGKGGRCMMWCGYEPLPFVHGNLKKVEPIIKFELTETMESWIKLSEQVKEKEDELQQ